jgi:toxin ParE1/3/4
VKVYWTPEAEQDRDDVFEFIAADNPRAAIRMDELFGEEAARLIDYPEIGHPGVVPGTNELVVHENYKLVYEIEKRSNTVWILAVVHTRRRWPP